MKKTLVVLWMLIVLVACGDRPYIPGSIKPIVDCAMGAQTLALVQHWYDENSSISSIVSDAIQKGLQIGGCAYAKYTQDQLSPKPGNAAPSPERAHELKHAFEEYRDKHANSASFKIDGAEL